jgi:crotonobetainyl-CoA:carnitine CoA-transferase CaiB-like acyl-CoA transferase
MERLPLEGIRILDHTIAWAGPQATVILADMGAEVLKIEPTLRFDGLRYMGLDHSGTKEKFWEKSSWFIQVNRNKLGLTLDLSQEKGKELYLRLVKISDVVINNFTPRVMPNLGLDYERLREVKPDIIMASMPGYGCTGPYKDASAFGDCMNAFCGLDDITGHEGEPPMRLGIAYGDPTSGFAAALAIVAALRYRFKTRKGQFLDISHMEAVSKGMDGLIDYAMNKRVQKRMGNKDKYAAPQGCYPCRGTDKWAVISIATDEEWDSFCRAIDDPEWSRDARFTTFADRWEYHEELDKHVATWTSSHDRYEVMDLLQKAGVAAAPVLYPGELLEDSHYKSREFFEEADHPHAGAKLLPGMICKMSDSPCRTRFPAPCLGQHNQYVFQELLGLTDEEMSEITDAGIIGTEPQFRR